MLTEKLPQNWNKLKSLLKANIIANSSVGTVFSDDFENYGTRYPSLKQHDFVPLLEQFVPWLELNFGYSLYALFIT